MTKLKVHPLATMFPLLTGKEYESRKQSIKEVGQLEPILVYQGQIVDGRTRYRICQELGRPPKIEEWTGDPETLWEVVVAKAVQNRTLSSGARAVAALAILPQCKAEAKARQGARTDLNEPSDNITQMLAGRAADIAGERLKVSSTYVRKALELAQLIEEGASPEGLLERIKQGELQFRTVLAVECDTTISEDERQRLREITQWEGSRRSIRAAIEDLQLNDTLAIKRRRHAREVADKEKIAKERLDTWLALSHDIAAFGVATRQKPVRDAFTPEGRRFLIHKIEASIEDLTQTIQYFNKETT